MAAANPENGAPALLARCAAHNHCESNPPRSFKRVYRNIQLCVRNLASEIKAVDSTTSSFGTVALTLPPAGAPAWDSIDTETKEVLLTKTFEGLFTPTANAIGGGMDLSAAELLPGTWTGHAQSAVTATFTADQSTGQIVHCIFDVEGRAPAHSSSSLFI